MLYGSPQGEVRAFSTKDGSPLWQVPVSDKVKAFCHAPEGQVGVLTANEKHQRLDLREGTSVGTTQEFCQRIDHDRYGGSLQQEEVSYRPKVKEMQVDTTFTLGRDGPLVATGYAKPGSRVPMVAAFNDMYELRWKSEVPGQDRLGAD